MNGHDGGPGVIGSPTLKQRIRYRSSVRYHKTAPGTKCMMYLRRCLAIQLQKVGIFPSTGVTTVGSIDNRESEVSSYWMYDSGYLIFQGFLEANLKCFWNGSLMEAMKVLEFQGYISPGVLLISGSACALEVVRAAWSRNVLKPPSNYIITVVGDVEDCLVEPISQGQFTPLSEALCGIILDMTSSGESAMIDAICTRLEMSFPDIEKPSQQLVYDTLSKLMVEKKVYQTANGYFIMTPDKMRLVNANRRDYDYDQSVRKQVLLSPEEAVVAIHGEIETVRDGNITHQAIQTNLADVICGGNENDKIIYPRPPSRTRHGFSLERLERRHSVRFFNKEKRSASLHRAGSLRHISDDNKRDKHQKDVANSGGVGELTGKHQSLLSRLFRRSVRKKRENSMSPIRRSRFSTQFPPPEWFNRGVKHLHCVGTQTSYTVSETEELPHRIISRERWDDDMSIILSDNVSRKKQLSSVYGTPRASRRMSHSATLPRRILPKISAVPACSTEQDAVSRISSDPSVTNNPSTNGITAPNSPGTSSRSPSVLSHKTIINAKEDHLSPIQKSMSSASSGYNSLPRSSISRKSSKYNSMKSQAASRKLPKCTKTEVCKQTSIPESSITFHVSTRSNTSPQGVMDISNECQSQIDGNVLESSMKAAENATTLTTKINSGSRTKIFLQQQNSPTRSLITFENNMDANRGGDNIVVINQPQYQPENSKKDRSEKQKPVRPSSLYGDQEKNAPSCVRQSKSLETSLKAKCPSSDSVHVKDDKVIENVSGKLNAETAPDEINQRFDAMKQSLEKCREKLTMFCSETELNNMKNNHLKQNILNLSNDKLKILGYRNILKNKSVELENLKDFKTENLSNPSKSNVYDGNVSQNKVGRLVRENDLETTNLFSAKDFDKSVEFPSLNDLSLHFTSLAAQNILKGDSYNSVDTLTEINMAAEKRNHEIGIRTDLGIV